MRFLTKNAEGLNSPYYSDGNGSPMQCPSHICSHSTSHKPIKMSSVVVSSRKAEAGAEIEQHLQERGAQALGVATHSGEIDSLRNPMLKALSPRSG